MWRLNNVILNKQQVNEAIKEEVKKKYMEKNENENTMVPNLWGAVKAVLRGKYMVVQEIYGGTGLRQETRKSSTEQSNLNLKELEKE